MEIHLLLQIPQIYLTLVILYFLFQMVEMAPIVIRNIYFTTKQEMNIEMRF